MMTKEERFKIMLPLCHYKAQQFVNCVKNLVFVENKSLFFNSIIFILGDKYFIIKPTSEKW
jgi:hypothetical protein